MAEKAAVLGAGAWGTTIAAMLARGGHGVRVWEIDPERAAALKRSRVLKHFPFAKLPAGAAVTSDIFEACEGARFIIFAVPSHHLRSTAGLLKRFDLSRATAVSAVKGIENSTLKRMSQVIAGELPSFGRRVVALSGPTIAREVALGMPAAATAASAYAGSARACQKLFMSPKFRVYTHSDVAGVEAGGSLKNVLALAAGMIDGLGMGYNTKAAMVSRGMRELALLGEKLGGRRATLYGLSGLGDLIVTSFSPDSRNRTLGEKIGSGKTLKRAEKEVIMVAEGVRTALSAYKLGRKYRLELPIIEQVYAVLYANKEPAAAVRELMARGAKAEGI